MLSRRDFLRVVGMTLFASAVPSAITAQKLLRLSEAQPLTFSHLRGRLLRSAAVNGVPLFADTIVSIRGQDNNTYHTEYGTVDRALVQPMRPDSWNDEAAAVGEFAEVSAPSAALRAWASPAAPLITRVGHGGILRVIDQINLSQSQRWLYVSREDGTPLGWTQASQWRNLKLAAAADIGSHIVVNKHSRLMIVYQDHNPLISAPVAVRTSLPDGLYPLMVTGCSHYQSGQMNFEGAPYGFSFGRYTLSGAYWHNAFGTPEDSAFSGSDVQVAPFVGRWLYENISSNATLQVV